MNPSVLAKQLQQAVSDYLRLSFATTTSFFDGMLDRFIATPGLIAKGPYLSIKLPFAKGTGRVDFFPDVPLDFAPYLHQEKAFQRIGIDFKSSLVATGTGSGKTECFLIPVLNYCYQNRHKSGIKAIFVYPMNALASDQAERLASAIHNNPQLKGKISAGIYVGDREENPVSYMTANRIISDKEDIRNNPPDILLTNYKMLDFLLIRASDHKLWKSNEPETLKYLVVDELHTFDGAQGTDLACLIRRLKARLDVPANYLVCVGTSATLGSRQAGSDLVQYAADVFDEVFDEQAVITEYRQSLGDYLASSPVEFIDYPQLDLADQLDAETYTNGESYIQAQAGLWFGEFRCPPENPLWRVELGIYLRRHYVFQNLLRELDKQVVSDWQELINDFKKRLGLNVDLPDDFVALLLNSLVSLISEARDDDFLDDGEADKVDRLIQMFEQSQSIRLRPLLDVRLQLWQRELSRLLVLLPKKDELPSIIFADDGAPKEYLALPAIHCRDCGAMGWLSQKSEDQQLLSTDLDLIYRAFFERSAKSCLLFPMQDVDTPWNFPDQLDRNLCAHCGYLNHRSQNSCQSCGAENLIWVHIPDNIRIDKNKHSGESHHKTYNCCPFCESKGSMLIVGSRATSLSSILVGQLSTSKFNPDKQLIAFSDAVQDTAHRAGYIAARTRPFAFRVALKRVLDKQSEISLTGLIEQFNAYWLGKYGDEIFIGTFLPNDMDWLRDFNDLKRTGRLPEGSNLVAILRRRLAFEIVTEFGFRSRIGRSLERSGAACTFVSPDKLLTVLENLITELHEQIGVLRDLKLAELQKFVLGFLAHLRINGGIYCSELGGYLRENGNPGVFINQVHLPNFAPNARVPVFLASKSSKGFETLLGGSFSAVSWYQAWLNKTLLSGDGRELAGDISADVYQFVLTALSKGNVLLNMSSGSGESVWGINPESLLTTGHVSHLNCTQCRHTHTVAVSELAGWENAFCLRRQCLGHYTVTKKGAEAVDFYGRLYRDGDITRVVAAEHTGLLDRDERADIEASFKKTNKNRKPWDINLLAATPTLELGVDIGDLSSVLLCSVPPAQANYLQRIGRAGRRDGNAINIILANANAHDLYFYADPKEMMVGNVTTPGVFLDASAVLERQYTAFCLDCWVKQHGEQAVIPLKLKTVMAAVAKKQRDIHSFPYSFLHYVELHRTILIDAFLELFSLQYGGSQLSDFSVNWIKQFAIGDFDKQGSLSFCIEERLQQQFQEVESLKKEAKRVNTVMLKLKNKEVLSPEENELLSQHETELVALQKLAARINNKITLQYFTDEGLIPNYAFPEQGVLLRSVIYRSKRDNESSSKNAGVEGESERWVYEYERPAASALSELAPLNTFYAGGRKVQISRIDMRVSKQEFWRLCRSCHHSECIDAGDLYKQCPRCGDAWWGNVSQKKTLLRLKQVYANTADRLSRILDDSDDRSRQFFTRQLLIDFKADSITAAWRVDKEDWPFGFEFIARADFREINSGQQDENSLEVTIAGQEAKRKGFKVCQYCGMVQAGVKPKEQKHAFGCVARNKEKDSNLIDGLYLYREFSSEAIRVLLPITSGEEADVIENSFVAALHLGLKEKFGGRIDHLRVAQNIEPDPETGVTKRYLVIYDSIPGGTGYLKQLMSNDVAMLDVLIDFAMPALEKCNCVQKEGADGCYQCLYVYRNSRNMKTISRKKARDFIQTLKEQRDNIVSVSGLSEVTISSLVESELEARFIEALRRVGQKTENFECRPEFRGTQAGWFIRFADRRYFMQPQVELDAKSSISVPSRADFVLWPLDNQNAKPVVIFTDGFKYHKDRVDKDSAQRLAILASNDFWVWSLSYDEVQAVLDDQEGEHKELFVGMPREKLQLLLQKFKADKLIHLRSQSSFSWLVAWLLEPDEILWQNYASAFCFASYMKASKMEQCNGDVYHQFDLPELAEWKMADLAGSSERLGSRNGSILGHDWSRLHIGWVIDKSDFQAGKIQQIACQLIFDDEFTLNDSDLDRKQWNGFLRLINIIQFQLFSSYFTAKGIASGLYSDIVINQASVFEQPDQDWEVLLSNAIGEEELVWLKQFKNHQLPRPVLGYEIENAEGEVLAEAFLGWIDKKVAFVFDDLPEDRAIFSDYGWKIYSPKELEENIGPFLSEFE